MLTDYESNALAVLPPLEEHMSFVLNFNSMHQWHPCYNALYMRNHDGGNRMSFDYIEVKKHLFDNRDVYAAPNKPIQIKAELLTNGRGMVVYEPMLATYFETDLSQVNKKEPFCQAKKVAFIEQTVKHKAAETSARVRKTYIYFPDHIVGTTEHIGGVEHSLNKSTELNLFYNIFKLSTVYDSKNTVVTQAGYAYWKIGVKGSEKIIEFDVDSEKTSIYAKTLRELQALDIVDTSM